MYNDQSKFDDEY